MNTIKISNIQNIHKELHFQIEGDYEHGLDKSIINAIRRTLLNDIPTVAFNIDEHKLNKDINIITNNTSLHNEMIMQRISLIPLYINPDAFTKNLFFECNVKHENKHAFQFITSENINIYPLNDSLQKRIDDLNDPSIDSNETEKSTLDEILNKNESSNYNLKKKLSNKEKDNIFKPFSFRNKKNYCLLVELKNTNSEDTCQELHFYGSPTVNTAKEHARYQAVSCATYSFTKNEDLIQSTIKDKIKLENIPEKDQKIFETKFRLRESERYFHRDIENEPYIYDFKIKSLHYYDSETLMKKSLEILLNTLDEIKLGFLYLLQEKDSNIEIIKKNEFVYIYEIYNINHTIGGLLQSHISRRSINDTSILQLCGYKETHPLEESIQLIVSLNKKNKIIDDNETLKFQKITQFIMDQINEIKEELQNILDVAKKEL